MSFPIEDPVLQHLENDILPVAMARMLVEMTPTGWAYKHREDGPSFRIRGELLPFPQYLLVYKLFFDKKEGLWYPKLYARIAKVNNRETGEASKKAHYEVDESYRPLQIGKDYWVRGLDHEERQSNYQAIITGALQEKSALRPIEKISRKKSERDKNFVDDYLLGSLRSSYAGIRYGKSIAKSDSIVTQVNLVSILAEIGGGPLAGLRGYYDLFPELRRGSGTDLEYFELRRASLGWAFSFELPPLISPLFSTFNIQPKIGLLDLKSHFNATTLNGKAGLDFNVKNIYDLALEAGLEKSLPWCRSRLWVAMNTANLGVSNKRAVTVKSLRGGMDLYFDVFEAGHWDVNLLTFANVERLEIAVASKS
ncbi:MAG: hypothetical protein H7318_00575, partial [Oligoflexus sp.]|nr:hypothetical protein [Oligoflexus sp.]